MTTPLPSRLRASALTMRTLDAVSLRPSSLALIDRERAILRFCDANGIERPAGVAPAAPMQGLAAYLRAQASALERSYLSPKDAPHDNIDTLRQWALEVDSAAGVEGKTK